VTTASLARSATAAIGAALFLGSLVIAAPGTPDGGLTAFFTDSEWGTWVGRSEQRYLTPADGFQFSLRYNASSKEIYFSVSRETPIRETWGVTLRAAPGASPAPGTYEAATGSGHSGPRLDMSSRHRGCNTSYGRFTIHQLEWNAAAEISRFAASYEHICGFATDFGEIRFNSVGVELPALIVDAQLVKYAAPFTAAMINVFNPGTVAQLVDARIHGVDSSDFAIASEPCGTLPPGGSCAVRVEFAPAGRWGREAQLIVYDGTPRARRVVTLSGDAGFIRSLADLRANPNPATAASPIQLSVRVAAGSGHVAFMVGDVTVGTGDVGPDGLASTETMLSAGSHWVVAVAYGPGYAPAESAPLLVVVEP
jgi:hypothetical protein